MLLSANATHPHGLGNRSGQLGRNLMFHFFSLGAGMFDHDVHSWRGPSTTFTLDDFVGPFTGPEAQAAGVPYLKGGICEVGGGLTLLSEAQLYAVTGWGLALTTSGSATPRRCRKSIAFWQMSRFCARVGAMLIAASVTVNSFE